MHTYGGPLRPLFFLLYQNEKEPKMLRREDLLKYVTSGKFIPTPPIEIDEGVCGDYSVEKISVKGKKLKSNLFEGIVKPERDYITALKKNGEIIMTDGPFEVMLQHIACTEAIAEMSRRLKMGVALGPTGFIKRPNILIAGLGLGIATALISHMAKRQVEEITRTNPMPGLEKSEIQIVTLERSKEVCSLVSPKVIALTDQIHTRHPGNPLSIFTADVFDGTFNPKFFDVVYVDIWNGAGPFDLVQYFSGMQKLKKMAGPKTLLISPVLHQMQALLTKNGADWAAEALGRYCKNTH